MKSINVLFLFILSISTAQNSEEVNSETSTSIYFDEALIYSYKYPDREGEFWIYHNSKTGNFLYIPHDEMIDFVIADSLGNFFIFGDNGHNEKVVTSQKQILEEEEGAFTKQLPQSNDFIDFIALTKNRIIDQSNISQPNIRSKGYTMRYKKMIGQQNVFLTKDISVNSNIIYGFNRMYGDIRLPVPELDFLGIFYKDEVVTHIERDNFHLKLENYGPNPYWATVEEYTYYIRNEDEKWEKKALPFQLLNNY